MSCKEVSESCKKKYASVTDIIATVLVVIGALNWGVYAILGEGKDIVSMIFGYFNKPGEKVSIVARVVFGLVAVAGAVKGGYLVSYAM